MIRSSVSSKSMSSRFRRFMHEHGSIFVVFVLILIVSAGYSDENAVMQANPDVQAMVTSITQQETESMLRTLVNFKTRVSTSQGCKNACNWAKDQFLNYGIDSIYLDNYNSSHAPNVIAILKGVKKVQDSIYMASAHIDDANSQSSTFAPGADDNGSGTISVILAAKAMSKYDFRNEVRFVLFSAEEAGLLGSKNYASKYKAEAKNVAGIINSDMLYWYRSGDTDYDIETPTAGREFANAMVAAAKTYASHTVKINNPSSCGGDHQPLQQAGYNAIRTLTSFQACEASPHYHKSSDSVGQSGGSIPLLTKCIQSNVAVLGHLAGVIKTSASDTYHVNGERGLQVNLKNTFLRVTIPSGVSSGDLRIYSLNGKLIRSLSDIGSGAKEATMSTAGIAGGVYHVKLLHGSDIFSNTIVISR